MKKSELFYKDNNTNNILVNPVVLIRLLWKKRVFIAVFTAASLLIAGLSAALTKSAYYSSVVIQANAFSVDRIQDFFWEASKSSHQRNPHNMPKREAILSTLEICQRGYMLDCRVQSPVRGQGAVVLSSVLHACRHYLDDVYQTPFEPMRQYVLVQNDERIRFAFNVIDGLYRYCVVIKAPADSDQKARSTGGLFTAASGMAGFLAGCVVAVFAEIFFNAARSRRKKGKQKTGRSVP